MLRLDSGKSSTMTARVPTPRSAALRIPTRVGSDVDEFGRNYSLLLVIHKSCG